MTRKKTFFSKTLKMFLFKLIITGFVSPAVPQQSFIVSETSQASTCTPKYIQIPCPTPAPPTSPPTPVTRKPEPRQIWVVPAHSPPVPHSPPVTPKPHQQVWVSVPAPVPAQKSSPEVHKQLIYVPAPVTQPPTPPPSPPLEKGPRNVWVLDVPIPLPQKGQPHTQFWQLVQSSPSIVTNSWQNSN